MILKIFFPGLLVIIVSYCVYLGVTYIDKTITDGEGYGFNIGESKKEAFQRALGEFKNKNVFILHPIDKDGFGPHQQIFFKEEEYKILKDRTQWTFYFDEGFFDLLKLSFQDDALISIHRHRKKFELP